MSMEDDFKREIPHLLVMAALLLILLVVVTKFKWVHCSQVPGDWCNVYCGIVGKSRVAVVSGVNGTGNVTSLINLVSNIRTTTYLEPYPSSELSASLLQNYELVVFEHARDLTPRQINAILQYADKGGSIVWVSDSGTRTFLSADDLADAKNRNESDPGYYEDYVKGLNQTKGFGRLSDLLRVTYQGMENTTAAYFKIADKNALIAHGLNATFAVNALQFTRVNADVSNANLVASIYGTAACTLDNPCPGIVSSKYAGYIVYSAIPLEQYRSTTALNNLFDFLVTC